ncbi:hypothetical protein ABN235_19020, partial [Morganella morganii]|uniref:hypothetical protein n=1 Tax=Morganella morganii TaxID=582 RepID=UPI0032DB4C9C
KISQSQWKMSPFPKENDFHFFLGEVIFQVLSIISSSPLLLLLASNTHFFFSCHYHLPIIKPFLPFLFFFVDLFSFFFVDFCGNQP